MRLLSAVPFLLLAGCADKPAAPPAASATPSEPEVSVAASVAFTEGPAEGPDGPDY